LRHRPNGRASDARRLHRGKHRGGWPRGNAARHPARSWNLAVAAGAMARSRQLDRLHLHKCGAYCGYEDPGQAFHGTGGRMGVWAHGANVIPGIGSWPNYAGPLTGRR
jgi:hypothetical protein